MDQAKAENEISMLQSLSHLFWNHKRYNAFPREVVTNQLTSIKRTVETI